MNTIKLQPEQARDLFHEDSEAFELIEEGEWIQDHKYQSCYCIYKDVVTGKYYSAQFGRSGSYHTDWYYDHDDSGITLYEVKKETKMIEVTEWVGVNE